MTEWYVNRLSCASRWKCFTFWLNDGVPYDRFELYTNGYELVNTHTLLVDKERGFLVSHDFEFKYGDKHGWLLVRAETPKEAWEIYDKEVADARHDGHPSEEVLVGSR